jgi:hypothetical protein
MISITKPKFKKTKSFLDKLDRFDARRILEQFGPIGVSALSGATPADTGETAGKWSYKVEGNKKRYTLTWSNSEMAGRTPLVLLIQYGHATKKGYFLSGRDFINPALRPVYDALAKTLIEEALG